MSTGQMNKADVELSVPDSWELLRKAVVGRLALIVNDRPDIFPVNHKVDHGCLIFRTGEGSKLAAAVEQSVAFEVDGYDAETRTAWSVVVKGTAKEVVRLYDVLEVLVELPIYSWHSAQKPHVIRIWPDSITGRRFQVLEEAPTNTLPGPIRHAAEE